MERIARLPPSVRVLRHTGVDRDRERECVPSALGRFFFHGRRYRVEKFEDKDMVLGGYTGGAATAGLQVMAQAQDHAVVALCSKPQLASHTMPSIF